MKYHLFFLSILLTSFSYSSKETTKSVISAQVKNDTEAAQSQERISQIASQRQNLIEEYRSTLIEIDNAQAYNEQLRKIIKSQKAEKISIRKQIHEIENTDKKIIPLMLEMLAALEQFIQLDIPFFKQEREKRIQDLKTMMDRADISTSEKYRRILEAYQIENEYGRTIGAYRALQTVDGKNLTVDFLRIGRLSLIYQTLDGKTGAYWSQDQKKWIPLSSGDQRAVSLGIQIARKQVAPNFITAWLKVPTQRNFPINKTSSLSPAENSKKVSVQINQDIPSQSKSDEKDTEIVITINDKEKQSSDQASEEDSNENKEL